MGGLNCNLMRSIAFTFAATAPNDPMDLEHRIERLERLVLSQEKNSGWVKPSTAGQIVGISPRKLVQLYDEGKLPSAAAKQINESTKRRRLLFDVDLVKRSIGGPVLA